VAVEHERETLVPKPRREGELGPSRQGPGFSLSHDHGALLRTRVGVQDVGIIRHKVVASGSRIKSAVFQTRELPLIRTTASSSSMIDVQLSMPPNVRHSHVDRLKVCFDNNSSRDCSDRCDL
jgi:hypothetical protein